MMSVVLKRLLLLLLCTLERLIQWWCSFGVLYTCCYTSINFQRIFPCFHFIFYFVYKMQPRLIHDAHKNTSRVILYNLLTYSIGYRGVFSNAINDCVELILFLLCYLKLWTLNMHVINPNGGRECTGDMK